MNTNPDAKTIVCYGDSNTWGADPNSNERYPANVRYPGVLQDTLGDGYEVINEGLCGRIFAAKEPGKVYRTGITHLKSILNTNEPIDIMTVMLGTNDMKNIFNLTADDITNHLKQTIQFIKNEKIGPQKGTPRIIVICPPPVVNPEGKDLDKRLKDAPIKSLILPKLYSKVAKESACDYLNAGDFINLINGTDGYHMLKMHHEVLGKKIVEI